ncbi:complement factor H-like [Varroa jacobsoni]|uniref:Sushi domain-containing protein n=1 Tax=Varroa destructor TaxID=109461 RepID=A0A7M7M8K8_VARDE|nr:complement factor H-like [Varroa destructor]XP_022657776.1 complement factor H-like [Varroa destructor]XP_022657777.1 complement factor H-like [Varroa destructor]XP_022657779.1 complement factor H-like [Varroa destructor]XP_022707337.1 complement factor H-like [Varroa jacobsoni]XP_022707338.1 complement factor H-like [Varroa jacobsoni]XP_022707339.1 complement factor H-like [Varroa jacobsoni]XP_022707340.1 complement factor H-like [Varroa jacobsoni]XP_022707341.1 complement factor H-like
MGHALPLTIVAALLVSTFLTGLADTVNTLTTCNWPSLIERIPHLGNFTSIFNGEQIRLRCQNDYKPTEQAQYAKCIDGEWNWPPNFRCIPNNFCRLLVEPSAGSHKVLPGSHEKRSKLGQDIFADNEGLIVKCRADNQTHSFACRNGQWEPEMSSTPCKPSICKQAAEIENGSFRRLSPEYIEPYCNEGYELKGSKTVFCVNNKWTVRKSEVWPHCERSEVLRTPSSQWKQYQWIGYVVGGLILLVGLIVLLIWCHLRRDSPKRNRLMHQTSHVDELLHLRRTKPIVIPEPVAHTQVHYTHDRKPIPVTSL